MTLKSLFLSLFFILSATHTFAADYVIDDPSKGAHAFVNFRIQHLGYSWLYGTFKEFKGEFSYDKKNIAASKIQVEVNTASIDTNHDKRDKHLRDDDFLHVSKFPKAHFKSTSFKDLGKKGFQVTGELTLKGVTKSIEIMATPVGEGEDPWGGYRAGFSGKTTIALKDFGVTVLGKASAHLELDLHIEGIRKK